MVIFHSYVKLPEGKIASWLMISSGIISGILLPNMLGNITTFFWIAANCLTVYLAYVHPKFLFSVFFLRCLENWNNGPNIG